MTEPETAKAPDESAAGAGRARTGRRRGRRRSKRRSVYARSNATETPPQALNSAKPAEIVAPPAPRAGPRPPAGPQPGDERRSGPLYAALDLGTNNCRLLIAAPRERGFRVVDAFSRIIRLGEGLGRTGRLAESAMDRAVEALSACRTKLYDRRVERMRLIATEACRVAGNGPDFVARVQRETGLALEIVSQETEARLAVAGCASLVDPNASGVILFDIGGGSTELVWIDLARSAGTRQRMSERIRAWMSLQLGVVTLSERHGGERITPELYEAMVAEATARLDDFPEAEALDQAVAAGGVHMLGTSGTITTLAGIHLDLPRYERRRVDGMWMAHGEVNEMIQRLLAADHAGRVAHPCIGPDRADLVMAGCAVMDAFMRRWPCKRLRVADRGLREGILVELMAADGAWQPRRPREAAANGEVMAHG